MKFSIITPVYNRRDEIGLCIESVLSQANLDVEHIIVDDGSTDDTRDVIRNYSGRFPSSLRVVTYGTNKGTNFARNRGVEEAKGDYIIFLDSDDVLKSGALSDINQTIQNEPGYAHYLFLNDDGRKCRSYSNLSNELNYVCWLSEKVTGDFAHVVKADIVKLHHFNEEFRIYEVLNWLRIFKAVEKQLFVPKYVTLVNYDRHDSVSRESLLNSWQGISDNYKFLLCYLDLYSDDLKDNRLGEILQNKVLKAFLLGIALGETATNRTLIELVPKIDWKVKLLMLFNKKSFRKAFLCTIILGSFIKNLKKR